MEHKYDNILVDVNNLFHKYHHALNNLTYKVKNAIIVTGGIYGSLKFIDRTRKEYLAPNGKMWFLFDNAKSKIHMRQTIDPEYKMNRKKMPKTFYRSLDYLRFILLNHTDGDYTVYETGYEADDIAPVIVNRIPVKESILIVSEDMDWCRLIDYEGRTVHQYMKKTIFDTNKFLQVYEFSPTEDHVVLFKTIKGDDSDNIPKGVEYFPTKYLLRLIDDYKDIYEVKENLSVISYLPDKWKEKIQENFPRLNLNYQLVSFVNLTDNKIDDYIFPCRYRPNFLKTVYESLGFNIDTMDNRVYESIQNEKASKPVDFFTFWDNSAITGKK